MANLVVSAVSAPFGISPAGRQTCAPPALAPDIELLGNFAGSAYRTAPRLVRRRDGQLLKLTALLYELVASIDGQRDHAELAAELGRRTGKTASAGDVRFLIEKKLYPLGVVAGPDGTEAELHRSNPLLALRPRIVISKAEMTRRLTTPFVWLFSPLVALPVVLAFLALLGWLLMVQGLSSAIHQALFEPWLILAVWGLVVASGAFHEIGHAAACRYGGGRPGAIGAGLYLVWPAFYTEVTDAYRLSRRDRLRVDLGGLYFSAIFALGTALLWRLTGADALLLAIGVQVIQMARQFAPFIRADGYHIVADLTGVPDLFAHMKPILKSAVPRRWGGESYDELKPWARRVITTWVAVTIPLLLGLLAFFVMVFPTLAATAWESLGLRAAAMSGYWHAADVAGMVMTGIAMVLVVIPVLAIVYVLGYIGRRLVLGLWRATTGRPLRRALAMAGVGALVGVVAWAWWPGERYRTIDPSASGPITGIALPPPTADYSPVAYEPAAQRYAVVVPARSEGGVVIRWITLPGTVSGSPLVASAPAAGGPPAGLVPPGSEDLGEAPEPTQPVPPAEPGTDPAGERSAWPFPFDPPDPPNPGDNRAMTVNLADGSILWDFAIAMLLVEGEEAIRLANEAHAYANCDLCLAGAVAFQVILIVGQIDEIVPINAAVAATFACENCHAVAFAYQIVVSITEAPSGEVLDRLRGAMLRLLLLEAAASTLSVDEIYRQLEAIQLEILQALAGILAGDHSSSAPSEVAAGGEEPAGGQANSGGGDSSGGEDGGQSGGEDPAGSQDPADPSTDSIEAGSDPQPSEETTADEATGSCAVGDEATAPETGEGTTGDCVPGSPAPVESEPAEEDGSESGSPEDSALDEDPVSSP
jgi:putative peptide zinc metalloprotease protein